MCTYLALVVMNKIDYRFYYNVYSLVREADVPKHTYEYEYVIINYDKCYEKTLGATINITGDLPWDGRRCDQERPP